MTTKSYSSKNQETKAVAGGESNEKKMVKGKKDASSTSSLKDEKKENSPAYAGYLKDESLPNQDEEVKPRESYLGYMDDESRQNNQEEEARLRQSYLGYLDDDNGNENGFQGVQPLPPPQGSNSTPATPQKPGAYLGTPGQRLRRRSDVISNTAFDHDLQRQASSMVSPVVHHNGGNMPSKQTMGTSKLAVATEVLDESLKQAEAVHPEELEERTSFKQKDHKCFLAGLFLLAMVLAASLFGTGIGVSIHKKSQQVEEPSPSSPIPTSVSPSETPSSAPSGKLDLLMESLPAYTLESLNVFGSPQWLAMDWLQYHPYLTSMEEWRKKQLFALATFFYSMSGENWPDVVKNNWLLYDTPECLWFDNAMGEFSKATGKWEEQKFYGNMTICNELGEFQLLDLVDLDLVGYSPFVPPEIALLTSLALLSLPKNDIDVPISDFLPSQLHEIPNLQVVNLYTNNFTGPIPTDLGKLSKVEILELQHNFLNGPIPSELGMATNLTILFLDENELTGWIPSEIGNLTNMMDLLLFSNHLTGQIPTELGMLKDVRDLNLNENGLTGSIPTELGFLEKASWIWLSTNYLNGVIPVELMQMTNLRELSIETNFLSGSVPLELALLTNLEQLKLENNALTGTIPLEFESLVVNGSLTTLTLANNSFSGSIPEGLCSLGLYDAFLDGGLSFDCNDQLCGCCWCPCPGSSYNAGCETHPFFLNRNKEYPGAFPPQLDRPDTITINIHTDGFPEETAFDWSVQDEAGSWKVLESNRKPTDANSLHSYTMEVASDSIYKLTIIDDLDASDGTCCGYGYGWFTITNSTPSSDYANGTVVWEAAGYELEHNLEVILSIDAAGHSQLDTFKGQVQL